MGRGTFGLSWLKTALEGELSCPDATLASEWERALGARLARLTDITSDSRQARDGSLFVALTGKSQDGHAYVEQALAAGAIGALVERGRVSPSHPAWAEGRLIEVPETRLAYCHLARAWRRAHQARVICVAGSVGKTTTKELLAAVLSGSGGAVHKTPGSQNGFDGVPQTLLGIRDEHRFAVVEVGIDEVGAMEQHLQWVEPDLALITAIGPEHLEKLIDLPTVAREEAFALTDVARRQGVAIVNLDDPWIAPLVSKLAGARIWGVTLASAPERQHTAFDTVLQGSLDREATLNISELPAHTRHQGAHARDRAPIERLTVPLVGQHHARNLLLATACARALGLTYDQIRQGLGSFVGAPGRAERTRLLGPSGVIELIGDHYNSNPASLGAALETLAHLPPQRWTLCLADMKELGLHEESLHRAMAEPVLALLAHVGTRGLRVELHGERMRWLADSLRTDPRGAAAIHSGALAVRWSESLDALAQHTLESLAEASGPQGALLKGSRSMHLEQVWERICARFAAAP